MRLFKNVLSLIFILIACIAIPVVSHAGSDPFDYVDPFIGTGGVGFGVGSTYPGPQTPYGMIKPGPDTITNNIAANFNHCAGYWYDDKNISGFSHTRMHGVGVPGYGNILIMPAYGKASAMVDRTVYQAPMDHKSEVARPGYYAINLKDRGIRVEITTGDYTAHHRFTYDQDAPPLLVLNASHFFGTGKPIDTSVTVDPDAGEIYGYFNYGSPLGRDIKTYFMVVVKTGITEFGTWKDGVYSDGVKNAAGVEAGAVVGMSGAKDKVIDVKVAISFIGIDQARANMAADHPDWDFDALLARTQQLWKEVLSRATVEGATDNHKKIFYTALYHSFQMPTLFSEAGGKYLGFDKEIHVADGFRYYTDFSLWDTFRSFHPLITLIAPEYERDMLVSLVQMGKQGGCIPKWPVASDYTGCMIGTSADIVFADSYLKGITDFDVEFAYENLRSIAMGPVPKNIPYEGRSGIEDYMLKGYHPADTNSSATSKTLEFAFNDFALAQFAQALGKTDDEKMFRERALNYKNLWNPETAFFDGRNADGSFVDNFTSEAWMDIYTEGTTWQWLWFVPHDVEGLIALFGGAEPYVEKLDLFFANSHREPDTLMYDKYYWHGNEPDIHAAYMYLWAGRPDRTQEELRWIMRKKYKAAPDGLDGNDDGGTLSAWYVFNAAGFFPIPATNKYFIGSPVFSNSRFHVGGGKYLNVSAPGVSGKNLYVQNVTLNGEILDRPYFLHEDIADGGELVIEMGPKPSQWGTEMK